MESILPDKSENQVLVIIEAEISSAEASDPCEVLSLVNDQPNVKASVEDVGDLVESAADSFSIGDQVIDHFAQLQNPDFPAQDLNPTSNVLDEASHSLSGRPRQRAALRGRPLDDQYEYY